MLLASVVPIYFWADAMGYMASAGIWSRCRPPFALIGLVAALFKLLLPRREPAPMDGTK